MITQFEETQDRINKRLSSDGYNKLAVGLGEYNNISVYHKRKLSLSKFGFSETFVVLCNEPNEISNNWLMEYSKSAFELGLENKVGLPRGLGSFVLAFPVIISNGISDELRTFIKNYIPKHWASFEFPVIVNAQARKLYYATETPTWGWAYYANFRANAERLFGFD